MRVKVGALRWARQLSPLVELNRLGR